MTRLDHNFSANWRFNAVTRFSDATSRNNSQVDIGGLLPGDTTGQAITTRQSLYKARSYIAALNGVITTALTNELRAGFVRSWTWSPTVSPFPQVPGTNAALSITGNSGYGGLVDVPAKRRRGADWPPRHTPWRRSAPIAVVRLGDRDGAADDVVERVAAAVSLVALHHRDRQAAVRDEDASDRKGQNNLWLMDPDGSNPTAVYVNQEVRVSEPAWTPDGEYIVVNRPDMRRTDSGRQGQTGIWMYSWRGGDGVQLVGRDVKRPGNPSVSPDGKHVYYHMLLGPDPPALPDLIKGSFQLRRLDRITGETLEITDDIADRLIRGSSGGALAPEISPDNRWLAFTRRIPNATLSFKGHKYGPRNALWLRDLKLGTERVLMDPVETDSSEGSYSLRVMPGYSWARDGKSLVAAAGGKLRRVYTEDGHVETIPFTARVHRTISEMAYAPFRISDGPFQVKFARWHTASPDGRTLAFQAVGKIYTMTLPDGAPKRLTPDTFKPLEYTPAWSPDGQWIAFTTRDEKEHGFLWKVRAGGGSPEQLVSDSGE